jgi:hypothetical protein
MFKFIILGLKLDFFNFLGQKQNFLAHSGNWKFVLDEDQEVLSSSFLRVSWSSRIWSRTLELEWTKKLLGYSAKQGRKLLTPRTMATWNITKLWEQGIFPNEMEGCLVEALRQKWCGFHLVPIHTLVVNTWRIDAFH